MTLIHWRTSGVSCARSTIKTIAGLKEEAEQPGEARKYAQTMLRQLTITRADLIAIKEKWLQPA